MVRFVARLIGMFGISIVLIGAVAANPPAASSTPTRVLVGLPPGGASDAIARALFMELGKKLNHTYVIENRPGASGSIAAGLVARAPADGATLLFTPSTHSANSILQPGLPFDTEKDFVGISIVATTPYVLVVHPSVAARDVKELVRSLKASPGTGTFAVQGLGSSQHLAAAQFKRLAGVEAVIVPYKGSSAALPDVLNGRVPIMFDNIAVAAPFIKDGRLRALAITSRQRAPGLAAVPTMIESGFPDFEVIGWFGVFGPAGLGSDKVNDLARAVVEIKDDPAFAARLAQIGAQVSNINGEQVDRFVRDDIRRTLEIVRAADIKVE